MIGMSEFAADRDRLLLGDEWRALRTLNREANSAFTFVSERGEAMQKLLVGYRDNLRVEVESGIPIVARTVAELRTLPTSRPLGFGRLNAASASSRDGKVLIRLPNQDLPSKENSIGVGALCGVRQ